VNHDSSNSPTTAATKSFPWLIVLLNLVLAVGAGSLFWVLFMRDPAPSPTPEPAPPVQNVGRTSIAPVLGEKGDSGLPKMVYPAQEALLGERVTFKQGFSVCPPVDWKPFEPPTPDSAPKADGKQASNVAAFANPSTRGAMYVRHYPKPEMEGGFQAYLKDHERRLKGEDGSISVVREDFEHGGTIVASFVMMVQDVTIIQYFFLSADGGAIGLDFATSTADLTQPVASAILSSVASARIETATK